jgi:hypothetical protein
MQKERERRHQTVDEAQAALDQAEQEHKTRATALRAELEAMEKKIRAEESEWGEEEKRLRAALRRARD